MTKLHTLMRKRRDCVSELDLCELSDLKYQLGKVVWIEGILGGMCDQVWRELEEMGRIGVEVRFAGDGES